MYNKSRDKLNKNVLCKWKVLELKKERLYGSNKLPINH